MSKFWVIAAALFFLSGCAAHQNIKKAAAASASRINDALLDDAITWKCQGASIGSILRRYGNNPKAWRIECLPEEGLLGG